MTKSSHIFDAQRAEKTGFYGDRKQDLKEKQGGNPKKFEIPNLYVQFKYKKITVKA